MVCRKYRVLAIVLAGVLATTCAVATPEFNVPANVAMATPLSTISPVQQVSPTFTPATPTAGTASQQINLDEFLPPGRGRDLLILNCSTCHSFVCAVRARGTIGHWEQTKLDHRSKMGRLSDEDYDTLFAYLSENLNDTKPELKVPQQLLEQGCGSGIQ